MAAVAHRDGSGQGGCRSSHTYITQPCWRPPRAVDRVPFLHPPVLHPAPLPPPPSNLVDFLRCPSYMRHIYMHAAFPPPTKCSSPSPPELPPSHVPPLRTPLHANPPRAYETPPVVSPSPVACTPTARYCMDIPDRPLRVPLRCPVAPERDAVSRRRRLTGLTLHRHLAPTPPPQRFANQKAVSVGEGHTAIALAHNSPPTLQDCLCAQQPPGSPLLC